MNQEMEINVLNFDGKDYLLLDSVEEKSTYYYFSNIKDTSDVMVLKDDDTNFVSIDDKTEFNYALSLFYDKYRENDVVGEA